MVEEQEKVVSASSSLSLYQIHMYRKASGQHGKGHVSVNTENLKEFRGLVEQQLAQWMSLADTLYRTELAVARCSAIEQELQRRYDI